MQIDPAVIQTTHPLYYAASFGMVPIVKALLKSEPKIDVNANGGRTGATAVWIASMRFNFEVVNVLLRAGADPTIPDPNTGINVLEMSEIKAYHGLKAPFWNPSRAWNRSKSSRDGNDSLPRVYHIFSNVRI
jgi:hypothetical protein